MDSNDAWESNLNYTGIVRDHDIRALANKLILPSPAPDSKQYQPASFDLTVGVIITPNITITEKSELMETKLPSGGLATVITHEELCLPKDMIATAYTMNNLRQRGLLVLGAGHIDPGYRGVLTLEIINFQKTPFKLRLGDPIITVSFERMMMSTTPYSGPYVSLEERIEIMRDFVDDTALAALLDINGDGLEPLVDKAILNKFGYQEKRILDLAGRYDQALEDRLSAKLDSLERKLKELEGESVKKGEIHTVFRRKFLAEIVGLIAIGAGLATLIEFILHIFRIIP